MARKPGRRIIADAGTLIFVRDGQRIEVWYRDVLRGLEPVIMGFVDLRTFKEVVKKLGVM